MRRERHGLNLNIGWILNVKFYDWNSKYCRLPNHQSHSNRQQSFSFLWISNNIGKSSSMVNQPHLVCTSRVSVNLSMLEETAGSEHSKRFESMVALWWNYYFILILIPISFCSVLVLYFYLKSSVEIRRVEAIIVLYVSSFQLSLWIM